MNPRYLKLARITSPILAIYGMAPILLYKDMNLLQIMVGLILLTVQIFLLWALNIYLTQKIARAAKRYVYSYSATLVFHFVIVYIIPVYLFTQIPKPEINLPFLFYILTATAAINTMIWVLVNNELLKQRKDKAEMENQMLKLENLEAQKKVLLQQLHPHFLFNALSTLKSLIRENPDDAGDYAVKLSEFLRYSIQEHSNELITLERELQFTQDYIDLQKMRFGDALFCTVEINPVLLAKKIPVFALQTLVENAIKHNAFTVKRPLNISITEENGKIKVTNNRIPKPLTVQSGTGLANLNKRHILIYGNSIEITDNDEEFTVLLNLLEP